MFINGAAYITDDPFGSGKFVFRNRIQNRTEVAAGGEDQPKYAGRMLLGQRF